MGSEMCIRDSQYQDQDLRILYYYYHYCFFLISWITRFQGFVEKHLAKKDQESVISMLLLPIIIILSLPIGEKPVSEEKSSWMRNVVIAVVVAVVVLIILIVVVVVVCKKRQKTG